MGWDALAPWRDARMGERGDLWHRAIIDPTLLDVVGPVRGLAVLDLGCGNGYLTRRWAREGARRAVGVDASSPTIRFAERRARAGRSRARFRVADAQDLRAFGRGAFDLVVANMALMDIGPLAPTLREVARVLGPRGRFVFSISHPCFDVDERSRWLVARRRGPRGRPRERVARAVERYREERTVRVPWAISPGVVGYTPAFHRTLATYSRRLREAGFVIARLEEPVPTAEAVASSPQGRFLLEIPLHLVVEAVRGARGRPAGAVSRRAPRRPARSRRQGARRSGSGGRTTGRRSRSPGSSGGS